MQHWWSEHGIHLTIRRFLGSNKMGVDQEIKSPKCYSDPHLSIPIFQVVLTWFNKNWIGTKMWVK